MKVLFIGGTGIISSACTQLAAERGIELTLWTRGRRSTALPAGVKSVAVDMEDAASTAAALEDAQFDVVVDWIAFGPADIERDLRLFARPHAPVRLHQLRQRLPEAFDALSDHGVHAARQSLLGLFPQQDRVRGAAACSAYREQGFPVTIVRPSLTYGETQIALAINSWAKSYTVVDRMRRGKKVIVPGDGSSLWVITHNTDFAKGLVGLAGTSASHRACLPHHVRRGDDVGPVLPHCGRGRRSNTAILHIPSDLIGACLPQALRRFARR